MKELSIEDMPIPPLEHARVLVAIPALNEVRTVGAVVREVQLHCPRADVLVVDDGSSDGTAAAAEECGALVCRLPITLGVGGAMRAAYRYAQRFDYDAVVQIDGDGQHEARFLEEVLSELVNADVVIGARFAGTGDYPVPKPRRVAMWLLAGVLSRLSHERLTDVTSGYRASGRRAIAIFAIHYPSEYLGDTVESLVIAIKSGCSIRQVPVEMRVRGGGKPSQSALRACAYLSRAVVALGLALVRRWPMPEVAPDVATAMSQEAA